ncbi:MAG: tRNA (N6-threonylcarbamoyladenosine(37)-N6)-methyltransferase TrmO [Clostridia bacterium]|nr:tRNA (N6-threonylcarbamoyladenosine(37)-N6)-methyltransferase TrmO [Clostridia bacterium]
MSEMLIKPIARIKNSFDSKFAIPRQSGILKEMKSEIIFEKDYRIAEALREIGSFSHLWLIWGFSKNPKEKWSPTVRPPKLGGNKRVGVFATRSPFRPNNLGLSSVKLLEVKKSKEKGMYLVVSGADLLNGTPIYDIKPYLPFTDIHPDATGGFTEAIDIKKLIVVIPDKIKSTYDVEFIKNLEVILSENPRPSYHNDPNRVYGFSFAEKEIKFKVDGNILTVVEID